MISEENKRIFYERRDEQQRTNDAAAFKISLDHQKRMDDIHRDTMRRQNKGDASTYEGRQRGRTRTPGRQSGSVNGAVTVIFFVALIYFATAQEEAGPINWPHAAALACACAAAAYVIVRILMVRWVLPLLIVAVVAYFYYHPLR